MTNISKIVTDLLDEYDDQGDQYKLDEVTARAFEIVKEEGFDDELIRSAIHVKVRKADKNRHNTDQLTLEGIDIAFGANLVIGDGQRIGTKGAKLEHVLTDNKMADDNAYAVVEAKRKRDYRTNAMMPYLARGMTVEQALRAYAKDREPLDFNE